jgi:hypothetical protein
MNRECPTRTHMPHMVKPECATLSMSEHLELHSQWVRAVWKAMPCGGDGSVRRGGCAPVAAGVGHVEYKAVVLARCVHRDVAEQVPTAGPHPPGRHIGAGRAAGGVVVPRWYGRRSADRASLSALTRRCRARSDSADIPMSVRVLKSASARVVEFGAGRVGPCWASGSGSCFVHGWQAALSAGSASLGRPVQ